MLFLSTRYRHFLNKAPSSCVWGDRNNGISIRRKETNEHIRQIRHNIFSHSMYVMGVYDCMCLCTEMKRKSHRLRQRKVHTLRTTENIYEFTQIEPRVYKKKSNNRKHTLQNLIFWCQLRKCSSICRAHMAHTHRQCVCSCIRAQL